MAGRTLLRAVCAVALMTTASCKTVSDSYDYLFSSGKPAVPPAALVSIKPVATPRIVWQGSAGSSEKSVFYPARVGNVVYTANAAGNITGFDAAKGGAVTKLSSGQRLSGGVGAGGGLIFAGTSRGEVLAFEPQGKQIWKAQLTGEVLAPPVAQDGVVVARSGDGRIYGLDPATGKRRWVYQRPTQTPLTVRTHAGLVVDRGGVFAGFAGGRLVALVLASGNVAWDGVVATPRGATELERVADVTSVPAIDGQRVCAVAFQGRVSCFDPSSGAVLWARDLSSVAGLTLDARYLYVTDEKDAVVAFDKTSGASIWKQDKMSGRRVSGPLAFGRYVVVGDYQGYLHFLSRDDGSFAARIATDGSAINAAPVALDLTSFLVQTRNGGVYAITAE
jgi:outer membrane protein assembly factor BamB